MKTKFTAILVILLSTLAFSSCSDEEIKPTQATDEPLAQGLGEDDPDF